MNKRFSKSLVAAFFENIKSSLTEKHGFDNHDGTHQLLCLFDDDLARKIGTLNLDDTDENQDKIMEAEKYVYNVIKVLIDYGKKELAKTAINEFDLYNTINKDKVNYVRKNIGHP